MGQVDARSLFTLALEGILDGLKSPRGKHEAFLRKGTNRVGGNLH